MTKLIVIELLRPGAAATLALLLGVGGSLVSMRVLARAQSSSDGRRYGWLLQSAIAGGATFWAVHLMMLVALNLPVDLSNHAAASLYSLYFAVAMTAAGFALVLRSETALAIEAGGAVVGLGVLGTHLLSLAALSPSLIQQIEPIGLLVSVLAAVGCGALASNRVARRLTCFWPFGGAAALMLSMVLCYGTGLVGLENTATVPPPPVALIELAGIGLLAGLFILSVGLSWQLDQRDLDAGFGRTGVGG